MQLSNFINAQVAQATTATAASVTVEQDMQNFTGCLFIGVGGTTSAVAHTMTINTAASTTASFVAATGASHATTGGNGDLAVVDVYRPRKRWLQGVFSSTANSRKFVAAIPYGPRNLQSGSTYVTAVVSPDT